MDFLAEVYRSLSVLDGAVLLIKLGRTLFWRIIPFIVQNADKKD